mmetsp:Transcript_77661/g.251500  ORF Transcript_77661/g.251500 Transcript_77661/m.251500 type:complete len:551 (-) Transcript_77661:181-1833(-)
MAWRAILLSSLLPLCTASASQGILWKLAEQGQSCEEVCSEGCLAPGPGRPGSAEGAAEEALSALEAVGLRCGALEAEGCPGRKERLHNATRQVQDLVNECFSGGNSTGRLFWGVDARRNVCTLNKWIDTGRSTRSCELTPPSGSSNICPCARFDCAAGAWNLREGWSAAKQQWCCDNEKIGCPDTSTWEKVEGDPFDCHVGRGDWGEVWKVGGHKWCCEKTGQGCLEISRVHGASARYASGSMNIAVGRPDIFADDPAVAPALEQGIAHVMNVDARTVRVQLEAGRWGGSTSQPSAGGLQLRGNRAIDSVLLRYSVSVPVDVDGHMALASNGLGDAMALAATSAEEWTRLLEAALGEDGGYIFSVASVGEVALSNVSPLPLKTHGNSTEGLMHLVVGSAAALVLCALLAVCAAPMLGQEDSARMPDLSPKKKLMQESYSFFDGLSDSTASPCKAGFREALSKELFELEQEEEEEAVEEEEDKVEDPKEKEEEEETEDKHEEKKDEAKKKPCLPCLPSGMACGAASCGPVAGCGSRRGATEPEIAGVQRKP